VEIVQIFQVKIFHRGRGMIAFNAAAAHSFIRKVEIGFDPLAAHGFDLMRVEGAQGLGICRRTVVQIESPKDACQTYGSPSPFQHKCSLIAAMKINVGCGGGDSAPPVNIGRPRWPQIRETAARIAC
jgi:hypothetical protein